jgi:hypothetical protein
MQSIFRAPSGFISTRLRLTIWLQSFAKYFLAESILVQGKKVKVLAVGAHPNNIKLGVGGTIAKHAKMGETRCLVPILCNEECW